MFIRNCVPCSGLGYYGIDTTDNCHTCKGSGQIEFAGSLQDYETCEACCGTGYGGISVRSTCAECQGTGLCARVPQTT